MWEEMHAATAKVNRKHLDRQNVPQMGMETVKALTDFLMKSKEVVSDAVYNIHAYRGEARKAVKDAKAKGGATRKRKEREEVKQTSSHLARLISDTKKYIPDYHGEK